MPAALALIAQLAPTAINLFQQLQGASANKNVTRVVELLPTALSIFGALNQVGNVLQKAQAEGWTDDDPRWQPVFEEADKALAAAEARLPAPGAPGT